MTRFILLMLFAVIILPMNVQAEPMVTPCTWGDGRCPSICYGSASLDSGSLSSEVIGYSFTTNESLIVTSLGAVCANATNVRLYDAAGDVLASETVSLSDPSYTAPPNDGIGWGQGPSSITFCFHALQTPVTLAANQTYTIVDDATCWYSSDYAATDPSITLSTETPSVTAIYGFGPNFEAQPVPEPSSLALLGVAGVGGLLFGGIARSHGCHGRRVLNG